MEEYSKLVMARLASQTVTKAAPVARNASWETFTTGPFPRVWSVGEREQDALEGREPGPPRSSSRGHRKAHRQPPVECRSWHPTAGGGHG